MRDIYLADALISQQSRSASSEPVRCHGKTPSDYYISTTTQIETCQNEPRAGGASTCCVNHYTASHWEERGGLSAASPAVSLPVYEACFSLTVSGIKRANPSETSDESFKRNNERHTAWGCISGWTYSKLERTAAAHDKQQRKNITASLAATPTSLTINHIFRLWDINKYAAEHIRNLAQREYF